MRGNAVATAISLAGLALIAACSSGGGDGDGTCVPMEEFFEDEVDAKVIQPICSRCHTEGGAASQTGLIFTDSAAGNMALLTPYAEPDSTRPSLLAKASGDIPHGGGSPAARGSEAFDILEEFVRRVADPADCDGAEPDDPFADLTFLSPRRLLRKATLSLSGRLPTAAELAAVDEGGDEALTDVLDAVLEEEAFLVRLREGFNDVLLTRGTNAPWRGLDPDAYPDRAYFMLLPGAEGSAAQAAVEYGLREEPLMLIADIVRSNRPFTEVLTADYTMANPYTAIAYGVADQLSFHDPTDPDEFLPVRLPGYPHAGVVTSVTWLNRYPSTPTNRNRHRAFQFFRQFLGTNVLDLAPPGDPLEAEKYPNPVMEAPQCTACHAVVDPMAGLFQDFNDLGYYWPDQEWYGDVFPPAYGDRGLPSGEDSGSLRWAAHEAAADPRFVTATVSDVYLMLVGRAPMKRPSDPAAADHAARLRAFDAQQAELARLGAAFVDSGHDLKALIVEMILSPLYRVDSVAAELTAERALELEELGSGRFLTPEMMARKVEAVFGRPWLNRTGIPALTSPGEFLYSYGGIDSFDSIERILTPNSVMVNVAKLMANEMACDTVAADFDRARSQRMFFPHVDRGEIPGTGDATERTIQTIVHLHERFLGERLEVDDPEILATYDLWANVRAAGAAEVEAGTELDSLIPDCQSGAIAADPDYTVRAWNAVVVYLASTYEFLDE